MHKHLKIWIEVIVLLALCAAAVRYTPLRNVWDKIVGNPVTSTQKMLTYSNPKYKFTFEYPSTWSIDISGGESIVTLSSRKGVRKLVSDSETGINITFEGMEKQSFPSVGTKVGSIQYDAKAKALVDSSSEPVRCLPAEPLMNVPGAIQSFMFGGSLMSTPTHSEYGVLSDRSFMVVVSETSEPISDDEAEWNKLVAESQAIYASMSFTDDVFGFIPPCSGKNKPN